VRRARSQTFLLALASITAVSACHLGNSILLVEVSGDLALIPAQLSVTVTAGGRTKPPLLVPPAPTTIYLPTSFTIELDGSITGPVTIAIDALDGGGTVLASGSTTQNHINTGGQTLMTVTLGGP
jgi:phage baseplate assembly protein gpV